MKEFKIKVLDIIDQEDGNARVVFDMSEELRQEYMSHFSLNKWDEEHWQNFVVESLTAYAEKVRCEKNLKNPDFLWNAGNINE